MEAQSEIRKPSDTAAVRQIPTTCHVQISFRPSHGGVEEPDLFFRRALIPPTADSVFEQGVRQPPIVFASTKWEPSLLGIHQEHYREFKPLHFVYGGYGDRIRTLQDVYHGSVVPLSATFPRKFSIPANLSAESILRYTASTSCIIRLNTPMSCHSVS